MKKIIFTIGSLFLIVIGAGIYKFDYLANKPSYDVDGNKLPAKELQFESQDNIAMFDALSPEEKAIVKAISEHLEETATEEDESVCDEHYTRYPNSKVAQEAGLIEAKYGATYCPDYKMHPSCDQNHNGINDCEEAGDCDQSVDYMEAKKDNDY